MSDTTFGNIEVLDRSIDSFDSGKAYDRFFDIHARELEFVAPALDRVVDHALTLWVEATWPSLLKIARKAREGDIRLSNGWTIGCVGTADPLDNAFVMEHEDTPGGFLFDCRVAHDMVTEASESVSALFDAEVLRTTDIKNEEERDAARRGMLATSPEVQAIRNDPASYVDPADCHNVRRVVCCVYRADGLYPPGFEGAAYDLKGTLDAGFTCNPQPGKVFDVAPSVFLQSENEGWTFPFIPLNEARGVVDPSMAIEVVTIIADAMHELDMVDEASGRLQALANRKYRSPRTEPHEEILMEMGMGAVKIGFPWTDLEPLCHHFRGASAPIDVERVIDSVFGKMCDLAEGDAENAVVAWEGNTVLAEITPDGGTAITLRSGRAEYRIEIEASEGGKPTRVAAAVSSRGPGTCGRPDPETRGFLFEFSRVNDETEFWPEDIGDFTTGNMQAFNSLMKLLSGLASVSKPETERGPAVP